MIVERSSNVRRIKVNSYPAWAWAVNLLVFCEINNSTYFTVRRVLADLNIP
jgi:hypothetical protein